MFVLIRREALPDATDWPGRRLLSLVDTIAWPAGFWILVAQIPYDTGAVGQVAGGLLVWGAARGIYRALFLNQRYRFITWRVGALAAPLAAVALALKLQVLVAG